MPPRRLRVLAMGVGALLVGLAGLAPRLPPVVLLPLAILWLVGLAWLLWWALRVVAAMAGRGGGAAALLLVLGSLGILTGIDWGGSLGTYLPCRRNWGWLPSYLLRSSPTAALVFRVDRHRVKLCYGQPSARGRTMIGGTRVPFGRLWRTGANEPTTIRCGVALSIAGVVMPPGRASLYTVPGQETWEIIVNRSTGQWGIESEYSDAVRSQEIGRAVVAGEGGQPFLETLTLSAGPAVSGVELWLAWESTRVRIPISVSQALGRP